MGKRSLMVGALVFLLVCAASLYALLRPTPPQPAPIEPILAGSRFTELRPPSTLLAPGTWVQVLKRDPLHLSIICGPNDALGLSKNAVLPASDSILVEIKEKLSPTFSLGADFVNTLTASADGRGVRSVTFSLKNIKLVEIDDKTVMEGFKNRSNACKDAIQYRYDKSDSASMIKSVLVADVEYTVSFSGDISADVRAEIAEEAGAKLSAKISSSDENATHLVGSQLVWGTRDDSKLAAFGYGHTATGGVDDDRSLLKNSGPIVNVTIDQSVRRVPEGKATFASADVTPLRQSTSMGCWATVYAMLRSWRDNRTWSVDEAVELLGPYYASLYKKNVGLPGGGEATFVKDAGMVAEPPANYSMRGFVDMLTEYGPLWITLGDGINSHAILLVGIYGENYEESRQAYMDAAFEFIDPRTGEFLYRPALEFMADFEYEAGVIVMNEVDNLDLRWQIIRWGST